MKLIKYFSSVFIFFLVLSTLFVKPALAADPVVIEWETVEDDDCQNFKLYRSTSAFITNPQGQQEIATISCIASSFADSTVQPGNTYYYSLFLFDVSGGYFEPYTVQVTVPSDGSSSPGGSSGGSSGAGGGGASSAGGGGSSGGGSGGGGGSSGGGGGSSSSANNSSGTCLINQNGTYFLLQNGSKKGITNPGMLYSYGYEFADAVAAGESDIALSAGDILLPEDGALVKKPNDPTVFLIDSRQKRGFVSSEVFSGLGFKFSSVLTVTAPELDRMTLGPVINNATAAHTNGLSVSDGGTVYYIYGGARLPYPSLAVYNSWNKDNDFTAVVPANDADRQLPVGNYVAMRNMCVR